MKQKLFLLIALFFALWQGAQAQTPSLVWQRDPDGRVVFKFSPDGRFIYGAGVPAIKIDAETGKTLLLYDNLKCTNSAIAISNDGTMVAGGGQEQTIHICDAATGKQIKVLTASITYPNMIVLALAFSNDDKFLLACASFTDHSGMQPPFTAHGVFIWDLAKDSLINMIEDGSTTMSIAANNKYFATGSAEDGYTIYNVDNNDFYNITYNSFIKANNISMDAYCRFSCDSKLFAYSDNFYDLKIYNIASQQGIEINYLKNAYGFCFYNDEYLIYTQNGMTIQNLYNAKIILNSFPAGGNIEYNKASNKLFVVSGTSQKLFDMSGISSVDDNNNTDYEVLYPNPTSNTVNIDFTLAEGTNVKIVLNDIQGNTLKVIKNEIFEKGKHTVSTGVSELSSGTYFINITTQSSSKYYKLIINN